MEEPVMGGSTVQGRFAGIVRYLAGAVVAISIFGSVSAAKAVETAWAERWRSDLAALQGALEETHPNPYRSVAQPELEAELDRLAAAVDDLAHHEVVVELARIVARVGDGHTRVTLPLAEDSGFFLGHSPTPLPEVPGLVFRPLPLRLVIVEDGVAVERIATTAAGAVGGRVLSIGGRPIDEVIAAVEPVVHRDNAMQLRHQLPDYLVLPEVLHARGVVDDVDAPVAIGVAGADGRERTVWLERPPPGSPPTWGPSLAEAAERPVPLYRQNRDRHYWFEHLEESRAVYWQYNEVGDGEGETLTEFADRLFAFIEKEAVERLIVDLRWNRGGSNGFNRPLLHHILRSDRANRPGGLFIVTGGGTFSAAMMFAVDLERHTRALFVGEPTGSSPNHFGDSRKVRLPETGLTVRISTLDWQYSDPREERSAIEPHLAAPLRLADLRSGRDPSLEAILPSLEPAGRAAERLAGGWRGVATIARTQQDVEVELARAAGRWTATLSLPGYDVEAHPIDSVEVEIDDGDESARVDLQQAFGEALIFVRARLEGDRLYGVLGRGPRAYPFALERSVAATERDRLDEGGSR